MMIYPRGSINYIRNYTVGMILSAFCAAYAWTETLAQGEFYQAEFNETADFRLQELFPADIEVVVYSHCLLPGTSEIKAQSEHADIFVADEKGQFAGLWILGIHSRFHEGSAVCSPATPVVMRPHGRLVWFTSSGSHYETGLKIRSQKFINIARGDMPEYIDNIQGPPT